MRACLQRVLLFAAYAGLIITGRLMLERGQMPPAFGLWWVHAVAVVLGSAMLRWSRR